MARHPARIMRGAAALLAVGLGGTVAAQAQDKAADDHWKDTAEFSYVVTAGNSETSTLGFKDRLGRKWDRSGFELNAGGVRAEATAKTRTAIGTSTNFSIDEESATALTAESYFLNGRYNRKISGHFFWFVGAGWDRNRFAGVQNRSVGVAGIGNTWIDGERTKFRTDYSTTYTDEKDVTENPNFRATFSGLRVSSSLLRKIGENATFTDDLILDENLAETSDYRANMTNSLAVAMSRRLALKVSLQWLYDHQPAFKEIDLLDAPPPAGVKTGTVLAQLDDLDTIFTASLVVNF